MRYCITCGKTFAVERLVDFLGWACFQIDASSVASPYIHETSKKVADVFDQAMNNAPSVLVIDEMEAFLADREMGSGHHRVEEVAEFLRRIPEATKNQVLIIGMTNRIEMIDPAILRRGRFDHIIKVDFRCLKSYFLHCPKMKMLTLLFLQRNLQYDHYLMWHLLFERVQDLQYVLGKTNWTKRAYRTL
ncbi:MAG: AAA family ATPase [Methylococcales bacterium]|nr:AAA family ATPase [Methylococcales bacterium]